MWVRNPLGLTGDLREWKARADIAVRNASRSGLSLIFLSSLDRDDAKPGATNDVDPVVDASMEVTFQVRGRTIQLPAKLVWFKRLPTTRQLLLAGIKLEMSTVPAQDRARFEAWVDENTAGLQPAPRPTENLGAMATMETSVMLPTPAAEVPVNKALGPGK